MMMRTNPNSTSTAVIDFLQRHEAAATLLPGAQRAIALQRDLRALLPDASKDSCDVSGFDDATVTLRVSSAGAAAKLRQTLPRLRAGLTERGWKVNAIRIRVQPSGIPVVSTAWRSRTATSIPPGAIGAFIALSGNLDDSPLKSAVERLIGRRRPR